ncbi:flagellin [Devosia sp.]|uniref:flagellin N-terminal helical domain-containing protein n=1 Tax=Devosia sp. TaxID=1871048 RepID=UPI0025F244C9|nr:flagellin [Devosia sp.]MCR6634433.1 flagellin [Devosia sp.]
MGSDVSLSKAVRANLLSLQNTASMMDKTQQRLATGNKVNSALDNPSNFFTASALNSRAADMSNLLDSMASGIKVIEAANNGITALTKNLESMQSTLRQARQDKSFQTKSFDVTDASVISLVGGQFGDVPSEIKLTNAVAGVKSQLTTASATEYLGTVSTTAAASGAGARTLITTNTAFADGETFTVAGVTITADEGVAASGVTDAELAATIQSALDLNAGTTQKYSVAVGTGANVGKIIIETVDPTAEAAEVVFQAADSDVKGTTSFNYSAVSGAIQVGGQTINTGATYDDFVASLQANATAGGYSVVADSVTQNITLTNVASGASAPSVTGIPVNQAAQAATTTFNLTGGTGGAADTITVDGISLSLAVTGTEDAFGADVVAKITADPTLGAKYSAAYDNATNTLTLTDLTTGAGRSTATIDFTGVTTGTAPGAPAATFTQGQNAVVGGATQTVGIPRAYTTEVAAEKDEFTVSYDGKTANISISAAKGGIGAGYAPNALDKAEWREETVAAVNAQLDAAGITGVEAKFDDNGKLQIVAKSAEAKTLAIAGTDAVALFGAGTVNTGTAPVSGLNATKTVDKFVELINRDFGGKVRASNDNGKLRLENLSTQELDVGVDFNGNDAFVPSKIDGNTVRANLSKQFNELRDQLDKLSDDSSFNGINLLRGDKLKITFNESGTSSIDIQAKDKNGNVRGINASNLGVDSLIAEDLDTDEAIDAFLGKLSSALTELRSQASAFGSNLSSVENRQSFTKNMINTLETGAANLTLADTNEEAANLLALQTRQQLSSSALSMASQQDQAVLQLLR